MVVVLEEEHYSHVVCDAAVGAVAADGVATAAMAEAYPETTKTARAEVAEVPLSLVEQQLVDRTVNSCLCLAAPEPTDRFPLLWAVDPLRVRPLSSDTLRRSWPGRSHMVDLRLRVVCYDNPSRCDQRRRTMSTQCC